MKLRGFVLWGAAMTAALAADLPVKTVVLYKHGVGFFEREGTLGSGESAQLNFNAADMNDVLKSLTIQERGGGKISGLRYDSEEPLENRLQQFPFSIGDAMPLSGALDQLKGSRIEVKFGSETVAGIIVSARSTQVATAPKPDGDQLTLVLSNGQSLREQLTLLLDSGEWRTVDLSAASGVRLTDPQLQKQFQEYFAAIAASRSKEKRSVYIDSTDAKQRTVQASYMIPMAVWKSSYRLIFGADAKPTLEGWAIVDNTTGEDWTNINLSLVSGRPISFVSQLYAPKFVTRPTADLPDDAAAAPVVHPGSVSAEGRTGSFLGYAKKVSPTMPPPPAPAQMAPVVHEPLMAADTVAGFTASPSSIEQAAASGELGELFEYRIGHPVTIKKSESAMLPFLQQPIDSRKLLIYTAGASEHPTNAAELTNSTAKTLDGGPITVYDGGAYGGEALMETLKAGDKRLISYAVDLGTRITTRFGSSASLTREIHVNRGILTQMLAATETRTYTIRNVDQKAKTLIIEHAARPGYTLVNLTPKEKTSTAYRFEVDLKPDSTQEFAVPEEHVFNQTYSVMNLSPDLLISYASNKALSTSAKSSLQQIANQKQQIAENDRAIQEAQTQVASLTADEERIRQNIQSLNSVSGQQQQVQNYAKQLDQHEQQLATLRDQQAALQKKKTSLAADLDRMIAALSF